MTLWIDAQLSPALARWMAQEFGISSFAIRELGLRDAMDVEIFRAAGAANAVVMTKDSDFLDLLDRFGPLPQVVWMTCGNTSNAHLRQILSKAFPKAQALLEQGERLVEITDGP